MIELSALLGAPPQEDRWRGALDHADQVVDVAFALGDRARDPRPRPALVVEQLAPDREIARPANSIPMGCRS